MIFPNEIWLEIFKWIEIGKLMELRLVCHQFYDLVEYILNGLPEWKKMAHKTILYECLQMTMQRAFPYELISRWQDIHDPVLWRGTYLSHKKWQKVLVNSYRKNTITPTSNISCVRTFDKYIAIALNNGIIENYSVDNLNEPFYVANHGTVIMQVEFWYSGGSVMVVSVGPDRALKFWDLQNKSEVSSNGFLANNINFAECRHFCICEMGGIVTSYERVGNRIIPGPKLHLDIKDYQEVIAHANDGNYMTAIACQDGGNNTVQFVYKGKIEGGKLTEFKLLETKYWYHKQENMYVWLKRSVMPIVVFCIGIGAQYIRPIIEFENVSLGYKLDHDFGCNIKSIALHAQTLMYGLEDGSIHVLYISKYSDIWELKEMLKHSKKIQVDTEPIVDLTVLEVDKEPCIVAVTDQRVHLINFF